METISMNPNFKLEGKAVYCKNGLTELYQLNDLQTIWNEGTTEQLISILATAETDGLNKEDYHFTGLMALQNAGTALSIDAAVNKEILASDAFLLYTSHFLSGKVDPVKIDAEWNVRKNEDNPVNLLLQFANYNPDLAGIIDITKPKFKAYGRLKIKLQEYRLIAENGGWAKVSEGETLKVGMELSRITEVKNRLSFTDYHRTVEDSLDVFDLKLETAVKRFQKRHGLTADGSIGKETVYALNVKIEDRIEKLIINMDRCRWLPRNLGERYVMVNLPAFELEVVQNDQVELTMTVAVGKPFRQTPVFSATMTYMVFNPYWTVPPTILYQDMIPAQLKNANYLNNLNIKVIGNDGTVIDPAQVNWSQYKTSGFPYLLRQEPGRNNALGEVKFIFPNSYNIYMHDTNHRELFSQTDRALSSGCIRLSQPIALANYLLAADKGWDQEKISKILKTDQNYTVVLKKPYQVHLQYWTAFVDEKGILNFRKDIYNRDKAVYQAIKEIAAMP
jgi:murein L,D-transpeptidase YcbB/YkuD